MPGRISQSDIERVREATDLVSLVSERVRLTRRGHDFWGLCPFHAEKTPSFKVDESTQLWHCFGCGAGGTVFNFLMKAEDLSFPEAVRELADRAHIELPEYSADSSADARAAGELDRLREVCAATAGFFHRQLMRSRTQQANAARKYLAGRGFGSSVSKKWQLGFAPGGGNAGDALVSELARASFSRKEMIDANVIVEDGHGGVRSRFFRRLMFPISDVSGHVIAFGGRVLGDGQPKYLNTQDTPIFHKSNVLFALDRAKAQMASTGTAIVAEGYTDVIALHEAGFENAVATLGTALTRSHVRQLSRHAGRRIIYLFDGDAAGMRATERALQFIGDTALDRSGYPTIDLMALTLPDNLDPAEFIARDGADAMRKALSHAEPLIAFGIRRRLERYNLTQAEDRARALRAALEVLAPIKDSIVAKDYAVQIAGRLRLPERDVLEELARVKVPRRDAGAALANAEESRKIRAKAMAGHAGKDANQGSVQVTTQGVAQGSIQNKGIAQDDHMSAGSPAANTGSIDAQNPRIRLEQQLLGTLCQNPHLAPAFAADIRGISFAGAQNAVVARAILDALALDSHAKPASLLVAAEQECPGSASFLSSATVKADDAPHEIRVMLTQLQIEDMDSQEAQLRHQMGEAGVRGTDAERQLLVQLTELQRKRAEKMSLLG